MIDEFKRKVAGTGPYHKREITRSKELYIANAVKTIDGVREAFNKAVTEFDLFCEEHNHMATDFKKSADTAKTALLEFMRVAGEFRSEL